MEDERVAYRELVMESKVPNGKLVRLSFRRGAGIVLSGDFFIYPEDGIFVLEKTLSGLQGDEPLDVVISSLEAAVRENGLQLVGLDVPVIARLFKGAIDVESHRP